MLPSGRHINPRGPEGTVESGGEAEVRRPDPFPWSESEDLPLPEGYAPTKYDVIYGRGRKSYNHVANVRFRQLIGMNLDRYLSARCKVDKTLIVVGIVSLIRNSNPVGAFLKKCPKTQRWISLSDESAREKVGHCLRDMIAAHRPEEKKALLDAKNKKAGATPADATSALSPTATKKRIEQTLDVSGNPWVKSSAVSGVPFVGAPPMNMWSHKFPPTNPLVMPRIPLAHPSAAGENMLGEEELDLMNDQDMSDQQRKILFHLETGFRGTVEELLQAAAN